MVVTTRQFRLLRTGAIVATCLGLGWVLTQPPHSGTATSAPGAVGVQVPGATAPRERITGADPITLAFAGDVNFENQLKAVGADPQGLDALRPYLSAADVTVVNLETAVTERGTPLAGKKFTFRTPPSSLTALANAGVDIVGLANNHAVDFGRVGLADTLAARDGSPVEMIGIGSDETEAFAPAVRVVDGVSVAILNASQLREHTSVYHAAGPDVPGIADTIKPDRLVAAVKDAAARYDVVVVFLHWGVEKEFCPSANQFAATAYLKEAGADAIIGSHAHRVQGAGWNGSTYVAYGLGNFIWYRSDTFPGRSTGVLTIEVDKKRVAARRALPADRRHEPGPMVVAERWVPLENDTTGVPKPVAPDVHARMMLDRSSRQKCAKLTDLP